MFFWFVGSAWAAVWFVFRDDQFDYRVLALGTLAVDAIDAVLGGTRIMHSVVTCVAVLAVVMLATSRGSASRRRWLALPIGMFLHLVFDGAFSDPVAFWWPFSGLGLPDSRLPSLERGAINVLLEAVGLALLVWLARSHDLVSRSAIARFVRDGRLVHEPDPRVGRC